MAPTISELLAKVGRCVEFVKGLYDPNRDYRVHSSRPCEKCFEDGGVTRKCCKHIFCDHCYTHRQTCPSCRAPTKMEAMTGAAFMLTEHSEHEECRKCLDPGLKRRCCGNYYCDTCYYMEAACRSCGAEVGGAGLGGGRKGKGMNWTIIMGWLVTVFLVLVIAAGCSIIAASEAQTPEGIFGYKCHGMFRTCDVPLCIEQGNGTMSSLYEWRYCKSETTKISIQGWGCVFDEHLYRMTNRAVGFPYDYNQVLPEHSNPPMAGRALGFEMCKESFNNGAYVFEDIFEDWEQEGYYSLNGNGEREAFLGYYVGKNYLNNIQVSAQWEEVRNGWTSTFCGLPETPGRRSTRALIFGHFSGSNGEARFAHTKQLDVSSGGWIEADMFMPPWKFAEQQDRLYCQPGGGLVEVQYLNDNVANDDSVDGGWTTLKYFEANRYRSPDWFKIKIAFDANSLAAHERTEFRFIQKDYGTAWGVDNLRIFRHFAEDWDSNDAFLENVEEAQEDMMRASCCYGTERCEARLSEEVKIKECPNYNIPGYRRQDYQLRNVELFLLGVLILCVVKFLYVGGTDWYIRHRFPFQDEYEFLTKIDYLMKLVPVEYRPSKPILDMVGNVHMSARMMAAQAAELMDEEEVIDEEAQARMEAELAEKKKRKREKRKRKMKLGYSKELASIDSSDEEDQEQKLQMGAEKESELTSDLDKLKRTNMAQLRLPFAPAVDENYRYLMIGWCVGLMTIMSIILMAAVPPYEISQDIMAYGALKTTIALQSTTVNFLAFCADLKEVFYTLKHIVPVQDNFIPMFTLDLSQEGSALYIGRHVVRLKDVTEANTFPNTFAYVITAGVMLGCFPWAMFMLLMRELYLPFGVTRILIPTLGCVLFVRVILGATIFVKTAFALYYLFDFNPKTRENIGISFQTRRTKFSALVGFGGMTLGGMFFVGTFVTQYALVAFLTLMMVGLLYGGVTGCIHGLPIRPWLIMTKAGEGTWLRVKKKERCPCIYWANWCTDVHEMEEVLIIYPEDSVRFFQAIKGGTRAANG